MPSILFVCTANRFRSPLAAALLRRSLEEHDPSGDWLVDSAGTWTTPGRPVMLTALRAGTRLGLDLSGHRSSEVSRQLLSAYDLVLVMQAGHREALATEFPDLRERIFLFSEVAEGRSYDIPDDLGTDSQAMEIAAELDGLIQRGQKRICALALRMESTRRQPGAAER